MSGIVLPFINGLTQAMLLFLIASGLTLVFGVMKVLNFAHGSFFMLGAYIGYTIISGESLPFWMFLGTVILSGLAVGLIGMIIEVSVLRRLYKGEEIFALLATFAILLILEGLVQQVWGGAYLTISPPSELTESLTIAGITIPFYSMMIILIGIIVALILWFTIQKTSFGKLIRASAADPKMTNALGVNVPLIYTGVFILGAFLAGISGLIAAPISVLTPGLAMLYIIQAFGVVVVGGLGNIWGALIAALFLSLIDSYLTTYVPVFTGIAFFLGMVIILLIKPKGILS